MGSLKKEQWIAVVAALVVVTLFVVLGNSFGMFDESEVALQSESQTADAIMAQPDIANIEDPSENPAAAQGVAGTASASSPITDVVVGTGAVVAVGDTVTVNYTGKFTNGQVFDSSIPRGEPFVFTVGQGKVIAAWDQGLVGMKVGGKRHLVVPPEFGYGPNDYGPIPGNSTLIFDIELLDVQK